MNRRVILAALIGLAGLAAPALAQLQSGTIYGTAMDASGGVLPGVTVTLTSSVSATKVQTTGGQGEYRFLNLAPGSYTLLFQLSGFSDFKRSGFQVAVGANTELNATLQVSGTAAAIEVSGEAPVLDTKKVGTATNVSHTELQQIPTARDPWVVLQSIPGVLVDRVNVGGSESGQQSVFVGKGDNGDNAMWNVDGVTITDMAAIGASPTYYDFDSFEEVRVTTGGSDLQLQTGGVGINFVTKRGGNDVHGSARLFYTNDDLQGDNIPAELEQINFVGNRITKIAEYGGEVGLPLVKDRLWFWGSLAKNDIRQLAINGAKDNTELNDSSLKINGQLNPDNQATFFWYRGDKVKEGRNASATRAQPSTWNQSGPTNLYKGENFANFGPNFYISGKYAYVGGGFQLTPQGGRDVQAYRDPDGVWRTSFLHYETTRPQHQVALDGNYFKTTGGATHEFKFGFNYRRTPVDSVSSWPGGGTVADEYFGIVWLTRDALRRSTQDSVGFYFGDTMTKDRLTLNAGARFDRQQGRNLGASVEANSLFPNLLPAVDSQDAETIFTWNNVSPRAGFTYALGEDRKTIARASYALYADQLSSSPITFSNLFQGPSELDYLWTDLNGDRVAQANEVDIAAGLYGSYYVDPDNPTSSLSPDRVDANLKAPLTHEFITGMEREVIPDLTVGSNFTFRRMNQKVWSPRMLADGSIAYVDSYAFDRTYTQSDITGNPGIWYNSVLGDPFSIDRYRLAPGVTLAPGNGRLYTNRDGYHQNFLGLEFFAAKRLSNKWMMRGSFSWNRWREYFDNPATAIGDPTQLQDEPLIDGGRVVVVSGGSGAKGDVILNGDWQFNLSGLYELPYDFNIAGNFFARQGFPAPIWFRAPDPDGIVVSKSMLMYPVDYVRMPNVFTFDFRAEKAFKFAGQHRILFDFDVFNLFNNNNELQVVRRANQPVTSTDPTNAATANAFLRQREIIAPRLIRFGVRWSF